MTKTLSELAESLMLLSSKKLTSQDKAEKKNIEKYLVKNGLFCSEREEKSVSGLARIARDEAGLVIGKLIPDAVWEKQGICTYEEQMADALIWMDTVVPNLDSSKYLDWKNTAFPALAEDHALKFLLGSNWNKFYKKLMARDNSVRRYLLESEEITKEEYESFEKQVVPVYEKLFRTDAKNAKGKSGGFYKILIEIKPDVFKPFFAKKYERKKDYEKAKRVQEILSYSQEGSVNPIICAEDTTHITVEPYIRGKTLTEILNRTRGQKEKALILGHTAADLAVTSYRASVRRWRKELNFLETLGKGGKSFKTYFREKFVAPLNPENKDNTLLDVVEKYLTKYMDVEDTVFCHGDAHTDNHIRGFTFFDKTPFILNPTKKKWIKDARKKKNPEKKKSLVITGHWIDWENAKFSIPHLDIVKLLKKAPISEDTEKDVIKDYYCMHAFAYKLQGRRTRVEDNWQKYFVNDEPFQNFCKVYHKTKIYELLLSAAKYYRLAQYSEQNGTDKLDEANVYFTDAIKQIRKDDSMERKEKKELIDAVTELAGGNLRKLCRDEYKRVNDQVSPFNNPSAAALTMSVAEKYFDEK